MRSRLPLLLTAAVCLLVAMPAPAGAAKKMEVAAQDDLLLLYKGGFRGQYMDLDLAYRRLRGIKVSRIRMNVLWANVVSGEQRELKKKPSRVRYDWRAHDAAVSAAKRRGMKVQLAIAGPAPAWATPKKTSAEGYHKPNHKKFKQFVKAVASRYKGKVDRFSIWNEPNWYTWLAPLKKAPRLYRKLYRAGYKAIKKKHPRAKVLIGELAPYGQRKRAMPPLKFMRKMTCLNGRYKKKKRESKRHCKGKLRADGMAHHPYDFKKSPTTKRKGRDNVTIASLGRLTKALDKMKKRRVLLPRRSKKMPVHLTEYGYFRTGSRAIKERKRARWTKKAFKIAQRNPRVETMLYYTFVQPPQGTTFDLTIVDEDGAKTRTWKKLRKWSKRAARKKQIKKPGRWRA